MPMRSRIRSVLVPLVLAAAAPALAACGGGSGDEGSGPALTGDAARGRDIVRSSGCVACHTVDGSDGPGPTFAGAYGSEVRLSGGSTVTADEDFLRRAITDPAAEVAEGYSIAMPPNALDERQVDAVVAYLRALGDDADGADDGGG